MQSGTAHIEDSLLSKAKRDFFTLLGMGVTLGIINACSQEA